MKFTDGYWQVRPGFTVDHPREAHVVSAADDELTVLAPTRPVRSRGDVLNQTVLTITARAVAPDVIRVTVTHFAGVRDRRRGGAG